MISVSGFLDAGEVVRFRDEFLVETADENVILLDCSKLEYLDSSGLAALVNIYKNLTARGGKLAICGFSESILRVLKFTKLDRVFTIAEDFEEAKAKLLS
ncbi:MAG: putative anti-sigma factor antagonist [bacterium]|nr:putative anti-sigma factor antagonist [bacterium]